MCGCSRHQTGTTRLRGVATGTHLKIVSEKMQPQSQHKLKELLFARIGARVRRPTEGVAKATLRSGSGWFVRRGSPKRFAQAKTAKHVQNIVKKHPGRSFLRRWNTLAAGPCFWPTINQGAKTVPPPLGSLRRGTCGTGRRFFWRRFFEHFLGLPFSSRRAFQYRFWPPFWSPAGCPGPLQSV